MYKVFVNDRRIYFTDQFDQIELTKNCLFTRYSSPDILSFTFQVFMENESIEKWIIYTENLKDTWNNFKGLFQFLHAAGGIVQNEKGELLLIYKKGKWDLPKGKIDPGESAEVAAKREVQEECGVDGLQIKALAKETYHIYSEGSHLVLKRTSWYAMITSFEGEFAVDKKEGIEKAAWLSGKKLETALENSYASVVQLIQSLPA